MVINISSSESLEALMQALPTKWHHSVSHQESRQETLSLLEALCDFTDHMSLNKDMVSNTAYALITKLDNYTTLLQICSASCLDKF